MNKLTIALALLSVSTLSLAESVNKYDESTTIATAPTKPKQAVGMSLGWVVANGLSYRRYYGSQFVQGTFAGTVNKDENREYIDFSVSYGNYLNQLHFQQGEFPVGFKFIAGLEVERDSNRQDDLVSTDPTKSTDELHVGLGFGLDFGNPGRTGILYGVDLIYTASFRDPKNLEFVRLGLLPSISLQYNL